MEKLTIGQREPLFQLVRYQKKSKTEMIFAVMNGWEIVPWDERTSEAVIVRVPQEAFEIWGESRYIAVSERGIGGGPIASSILTFVLRQEALDYESFMHKPRLIRNTIRLWEKMVEDVPSLIWGIVIGIMTVIILKWLGLS